MNTAFTGQAQWLLNALLAQLQFPHTQPQVPPATLAVHLPHISPLQPVGYQGALQPWIQQTTYDPLQQWFQLQLQAMGLMPQQYQPHIAGPVQGQLLHDLLAALQMQLGKDVKREDVEDLSPGDEKALVDALQKGWQDGAARLQVFEELSKVRNRVREIRTSVTVSCCRRVIAPRLVGLIRMSDGSSTWTDRRRRVDEVVHSEHGQGLLSSGSKCSIGNLGRRCSSTIRKCARCLRRCARAQRGSSSVGDFMISVRISPEVIAT